MHEVIIETTEHQRQMGDYGTAQMEQVITMYRDRFLHYSRERKLAYIIIFKNEGIQAGATLDHPHTQLIALPVVPQNIREELEASESYHRKKSGCIYCDLVEKEEEQKLRIISVNQHFVSLSAWAARFPFESWIIPRAHQARFENLEDVQIHSLGQILKSTLKRMGSVLGDLSYNFMIHSAPFHISADLYYHWHIKILPRTTNIAGFEYGTGYYINPVPPEEAAEKMRIITFHS